MKKILLIGLFCLCAVSVRAAAGNNDEFRNLNVLKGTQLYGGYSRNFGEKEEKYNVFEIGLGRVNFGGTETSGYNYYAGSELVFNSRHFSLGPKAGASFSIWMFGLGGELIYYTDFSGNTLHFAPYLTFGAGMTKLNVKYHAPLYNKDYAGINQVSLGITIGLTKPK